MQPPFCLLKNHTEHRQNNQKHKVKGGKQQDIVTGFAPVVFAVFPEGNEAGQRRNQCAHATDIDAQQQVLVIGRKLGKENCRRHIADHLTGQSRNQQGIFLQKVRKQVANSLNPRHIPRKNKRVFQFFKDFYSAEKVF